MGDVAENLSALVTTAEQAEPRPRGGKILGWEPGFELNEASGSITSGALPNSGDPDWVEIFAFWKLDPDVWSVVDGTIEVRAWNANMGEGEVGTFRYYKAKLKRRTTSIADVESLIADIMKIRITPPQRTGSDEIFVVVFSDPQFGKGLESLGTAEIVDRWMAAIAEVKVEARGAKRRGVDTCVIQLPGDTIEGCSGHYPMETFTVDLDQRQQVNVARRCTARLIRELAPMFARVHVMAAPGNHGENRDGAKQAYTTPSDNMDLAIVDQVADVLTENPESFDHVEFHLPAGQRPWVTWDHESSGLRLGLHHGNVRSAGPAPVIKVSKWWQGQSHGRSSVGDADVLTTGHWHHHFVDQSFGRTIVGAPSLDNGSLYWEHATGQVSPPGAMTFVVSHRIPGFVDRVRVLGKVMAKVPEGLQVKPRMSS